MYSLIIKRKSSLTAAAVDYKFTVDNKPVGLLGNGKKVNTEIKAGHHVIHVYRGLLKPKQVLEYEFDIPENQTRTTLVFKVNNWTGRLECIEIIPEFINEQLIQKEIIALKKKNGTFEHKLKCNVCGNIFCYTDGDKSSSDFATTLTLLACTSSALSKNKYDSYERGKMANSISKGIHDFNKCPSCNSRDIIEITDTSFSESTEIKHTTNDVQHITEQIETYKNYLESGLITQEEFETKRKQLLNL